MQAELKKGVKRQEWALLTTDYSVFSDKVNDLSVSGWLPGPPLRIRRCESADSEGASSSGDPAGGEGRDVGAVALNDLTEVVADQPLETGSGAWI